MVTEAILSNEVGQGADLPKTVESECAPLPEIVIPEQVCNSLQLGTKNICELLIEWDENAETWKKTNNSPSLLITLDRAGTLAFIPIKAALELYEISLPKTAHLHVGRELIYRFIRETSFTMKQLKDLEQNAVEGLTSWVHDHAQEEPLMQILTELRALLKSLPREESKVLVIDDVVQGCTTLGLLMPTLITEASTGEVSFTSPNQDLSRFPKVQRSTGTHPHPRISLMTVLENTEWLYDCIDGSFVEYLDQLYVEKKIVTRKLLVQLAKGSVEDIETGELEQLATKTQIMALGHQIQQQFLIDNYTYHEETIINPGNPGMDLIEKYGVEQLLEISNRFKQALELVGQTAAL